jgi:peptidoglycan/xylan/chitin deacetylase (PgdA/CDA1 family)
VLNRLPVLLYHHVGPARPGTSPWLTVSDHRFGAQLRRLRGWGWRTIGAEEVAAWLLDGRPLPRRAMVITFDDAYADLAKTAFPLLERAGFRATVFVPTAHLGATNAWEAPAAQGHRLLDPAAVRRWSKRGIEFGAHTRSHADLTRLDRAGVEREVLGGKRDLEELLQAPVDSFAYPYGVADPVSRSVVASAFRIAFTALEGPNRADADPHSLRRTMVQSVDTALDLGLRLRLGRSPVRLARQQLGVTRRRLRERVQRPSMRS